MKKTNAVTKNSELTSILNTPLQGEINLARLKLVAHFFIVLYKVQTVIFEKLVKAFYSKSNSISSLRRIQRFIESYSLNSNLTAQLILTFYGFISANRFWSGLC